MKRTIKLLGLRLARTLGLFALSRRLTRGHTRILCYHGGCIGDESRFNPKLFIRTATFSARMAWLQAAGFTVVSLDAMSAALQAGRASAALPVALTFDDGWHSTTSELLPVLARMGLPSTLYLCTEHYLEQWPVPAVVLRYLFWKAGARPVAIAGFHPDVDGTHDLAQLEARNHLADAVRDVLLAGAPTERSVCEGLERFAACLDLPPSTLALAQRRFAYVTPAELVQVPDMLCQVELHGHVHRYPNGQPARFQADLETCAHIIGAAGLPRPHHYCYPSGSHDAGAAPVLQQLGVLSATTCKPGLVGPDALAQRHFLPRFLDGEDVDPLEFEAELSGFNALFRRSQGDSPPYAP